MLLQDGKTCFQERLTETTESFTSVLLNGVDSGLEVLDPDSQSPIYFGLRQTMKCLEECSIFRGARSEYSEHIKKSVAANLTSMHFLIKALLTLSIEDRSPKRLGLLLKIVLILAHEKNQNMIETVELKTVEPKQVKWVLRAGLKAAMSTHSISTNDANDPNASSYKFLNVLRGQHNECSEPDACSSDSADKTESEQLLETLQFCSNLLPLIVQVKNGFSKESINFLCSKYLFTRHEIDLSHLKDERIVTSKTTTLTADTVICIASGSMDMGDSFDDVWILSAASRWLKKLKQMSGESAMQFIGVLVLFISVCVFANVLITETIKDQFLQVLIPVSIVYAFICFAQSIMMTITGSERSSLLASEQGHQTVVAHVLNLQELGSLKSLEAFLAAPVDLFETPAVRAVVRGTWSKFQFGFFLRFALYIGNLLLFSVFVCECIAPPPQLVNDKLTTKWLVALYEGPDRPYVISGCGAAFIAIYFLSREIMKVSYMMCRKDSKFILSNIHFFASEF